MDYAQEQRDELEALEAIYMEDLVMLEDTGGPPRFVIRLEHGDDDGYMKVYPTLRVAYTNTYPETEPSLSVEGFPSAQAEDVQRVIREQVEENAGMPVVFAVASALQEWLAEHRGGDADAGGAESELGVGDGSGARGDEDAPEDNEFAEDADRVEMRAIRADGTPVTVESFALWKAKFEEELRGERQREDERAGLGPTGRELFEKKLTDPNDLDLGAVSIEDEALFEDEGDLDDVDLSDEES